MYEIVQNTNYHGDVYKCAIEKAVTNQSSSQSHDIPLSNSPVVTKLSAGQETEVIVDPGNRYSPTKLQVIIGEQYRFEANGKWADASQRCGPEGWSAWWTFTVKPLVRLPGKDLFYLCGNVNCDERTNFPIGSSAEKTIEIADGQLYLFANDLWYFYGNNHELQPEEGGPMKVKIRRIK